MCNDVTYVHTHTQREYADLNLLFIVFVLFTQHISDKLIKDGYGASCNYYDLSQLCKIM